MKCKISASRRKSIHWIERLDTEAWDGQAYPWVGNMKSPSAPCLNLLSQQGQAQCKQTLSVSYSFSSVRGNDLSKVFSEIRLKEKYLLRVCLTIRSGSQIKTKRNPYNNYVHVMKMDISCIL